MAFSIKDAKDLYKGISSGLVSLYKPYAQVLGEAAYQGGKFVTNPLYRRAILNPESFNAADAAKLSQQRQTAFLKPEQISNRGQIVKTGAAATGKALLSTYGLGNPVSALTTAGLSGGLTYGIQKVTGQPTNYKEIGQSIGQSPIYAGVGKLTMPAQNMFTNSILNGISPNAVNSLLLRGGIKGSLAGGINMLENYLTTPLLEGRKPTKQENVLAFGIGVTGAYGEEAFNAIKNKVTKAIARLKPNLSPQDYETAAGTFIRNEVGQFMGFNPNKPEPVFIKDKYITDSERIQLRRMLGLPDKGLTSADIPLGLSTKEAGINPDIILKQAQEQGVKPGMIGRLEKRIDDLLGTGGGYTGNWKQDYYLREKMINESEAMGAPPQIINEVKKLQETIDNLRVMKKVKAESTFRSQAGEKGSLKGLLTESYAQTKFRREQNLKPDEVYLEQKFKADDFERQMRSFNVDVKEKANIIDIFKTPENVLNKLGLGQEFKTLRGQWEKYQAELPVEVNRIQQWAKSVSPESNPKIFDYLDGKLTSSDLSINELKTAREIRDYLSQWADKLGLPKDKRITNYITHIFEPDVKGKEFPPELANLIRESGVAKSTYNPFLQKRTGFTGYKKDVWGALNAYVKRAVRKVNLDPALKDISRASKNLEDSQYRYVKKFIDNVQMRPTEVDTFIDNAIKSSPIGYRFGTRPVTYLTQKLRQIQYRGLIGLNPASALKNLTQGANTYAELGEKYTFTGYSKVLQNLGDLLSGKDTELNKVGVLNDEFIQDKELPVFKSFLNKLDDKLFYMFETAEKINRGAAYWGAKAKAINNGMSEEKAIEYAKEIVRKTQFQFSRIDTPVGLQSDLAKTLGQFQSFTLKQFEFLGNKVSNKEWAGLVRYTLATFVFTQTMGKLMGWSMKDLLPSFRFGVPPTLSLPVEVGKAIAGTEDKYGNVPSPQERLGNVANAAIPYFPGGLQLKKTYQGLSAFNQGGSFTPTGKERFKVGKTPGNFARSALFGQYGTPEGQQYIQNRGKTKGEILYNQLKKLGPEKAALRAKQLKTLEPEAYQQLIDYGRDRSLNITTKEKQVRNLGVKDGARARQIVKLINSKNTPKDKADTYKRFIQLGIITSDIERQLIAARKAGALK